MLRLIALLFVLALWPAAAGGQAPAWDDAMAAGETAFAKMDLAGARKGFEAALQAAEGFPPGDPRLGLTLAGLGTVLNGLGDYAGAEPLLERALGIWEKSPPDSELHRATALHGLAGLYYARGEIEAAEPLLLRALAIREKALAAEHPAVLQTRKSLATLKRTKGRQDKATPKAQTAAKPAETAPPPSPAKPGGYAIHLASLRTVAGAERQWAELQAAFPALLGGLPLALAPADLGERGVFQRVLTGSFAQRAEASDLCARLKAESQYCTVVRR